MSKSTTIILTLGGLGLLASAGLFTVGLHALSRPPAAEGSATLRIGGSTTLAPSIGKAARQFSHRREVTIVNSITGSGRGIEKLIAGEIDIARSSRPLRREELDAAEQAGRPLRQLTIGFDAIAVIVHPSRAKTVASLSRRQLADIFFTGATRDWSAISSDSGPIRVVCGDNRSGTTQEFNRLITGQAYTPFREGAEHLQRSTDVMAGVARDPHAISYVSYGVLSGEVTPVAMRTETGGVVPCHGQSVPSGRYPLRRELLLIVQRNGCPATMDFVTFVLSPAGQRVLDEHDLIPLR